MLLFMQQFYVKSINCVWKSSDQIWKMTIGYKIGNLFCKAQYNMNGALVIQH